VRRWLPLVFIALFLGGLVYALTAGSAKQVTMARYITPLDGRMGNQRHNAVLCLKQLDGFVLLPGATFSFNETVGTWSRDKGYRRAPVSFGGLLVDSWGGGVCQTSSTLYNAALLAGMQIDERHRHHYAPTYISPGRDAAVAYPSIDLKFTNPYPFPVTVEGTVTPNGVVIDIVGSEKPTDGIRIQQRIADVAKPQELLIGSGRYGRVRNPGHAGYSVETYRVTGDTSELLSVDCYPVMNKVVEYKGG
jgi:vancomycin resistance protein YoaR